MSVKRTLRHGTAKSSEKKDGRIMNGLNIFLSVLILLSAVLTVPCYIKQYQKNKTASNLTKELQNEINIGTRLRIEYEIRSDYKTIEDYVSNNLSMKKVDNYQIEYLMRETGNVSVVVYDEDDDGNFLTDLARTFSAITEFFR